MHCAPSRGKHKLRQFYQPRESDQIDLDYLLT